MRISSVAITGAVLLGMVACDPNAPIQDEVFGARDDVRHVSAVKREVQEQKYKNVCTSRKDGKCKSTRRVKDGPARTVTEVIAPEYWCVELDAVNGAMEEDDIWYTTSRAVYLRASGLSEGDQMKFRPVHGGCW